MGSTRRPQSDTLAHIDRGTRSHPKPNLVFYDLGETIKVVQPARDVYHARGAIWLKRIR